MAGRSRNSASTSARRSSVLEALNVMGDHWMLRLLGRLFVGITSWSEITSSMNVSPSTLSKRLRQLTDSQCLEPKSARGQLAEYKLTERGKALFPILAAADEWRIRWDDPDGDAVSPWIHECGKPLRCRSSCNHCDKDVYITEVSYEPGSDVGKPGPLPAGRHFRNSAAADGDHERRLSRLLQVLGDRRTSQLLAAFYLGYHRFDEFEEWTGMHPAIVADRLRKMQHLGMVHMRLYQERPDRYHYSLTAAGRDMYMSTLEMLNWGDKWIYGRGKEPLALTHKLCGKRLRPILKCIHCGNPVHYDSVRPAK